MNAEPTTRRETLILKSIVSVFVGVGVTAVQVILSTFVKSQLLNWALPGYFILDGLYHRLRGIPLLAVAILANITCYGIVVFVLLLLLDRRPRRSRRAGA